MQHFSCKSKLTIDKNSDLLFILINSMFFFDQAKCTREYILLLTVDLRIAGEFIDATKLGTMWDSLSTRQSIQQQNKCSVPYINHSHVRSRQMYLERAQEKSVVI